jgi:VanZ family protein
MSRTPRAISLWLPVIAWAAVIFALSSIPSLNSGLGSWDFVLRKLAHAAEYALLAVLLVRALTRPWLAFLVALAYAASDELHQHFVHGRIGAPRDVAIDAVGALIGLAAFSYGRRRFARPPASGPAAHGD